MTQMRGLFFAIILTSTLYAWSVSPDLYWGDKQLKGTVYVLQGGEPLAGAAVVLLERNTGTLTDQEGRFVFTALREGVYTLQVSYMGFRSQWKRVELSHNTDEVVFWLEATHIELDEVIVRESRTGMIQPEQSVSVTIAGSDFLRGASTTTLAQSLQRLPGIHSMDIGTGISKPMIRGLGFNRLVVAQNNIKQQGQQWGADHGLEVDPYAVERVEITKGPAALLYGSDAIGGALNIRPPVIPQENSTSGEVIGVAHSNNDLLGGSAMLATHRQGRFLRLRMSFKDYADYRVPADEFVYNTWRIPIPQQRLKNTSGTDRGFSVHTGIRRGWGISSLSVSNFKQVAGFFPASHGIPNPGSLQQPGNPRRTDYPRQEVSHLMATWNSILLLGAHHLEVDLGYQNNHRQELNPPHVHGLGPLPEGFTELELILHTFSAGIRYHHKPSAKQSFVVGMAAGAQQNIRGGYNFLLPDYRSADWGVFGISRYAVSDRFRINGGVRVDFASLVVEGFQEPVWLDNQTISHYRERAADQDRHYANLAFSTGLSWMPQKDFNVTFNVGRSFRNPNPIELSANGIHHGSFRHEQGDTALVPERAWQLDVGFTWSVKEFYFNVSPFVNYFPNFLFLNPSGVFSSLPGAGQIWRFEQAPALHLGGELYADWHITHALHASLGAEWVWARNLDEHYPLPNTPPAALLTELNYDFGNLHRLVNSLVLKSSLRAVGAQHQVARNEPPTQGYLLLNAGVQFKRSFFQRPLEALVMVNNLMDKRYQNHLSFYRILELPEPGRNITLQIRMGLF